MIAFLPSVLFGWTLETVPVDSIGIGGWVRMLAFAAVAAAAPIVCAAACAAGRTRPVFAALLGRPDGTRDGLDLALGVVFIALTLLSVETALGLVFDPRYRDIPFAPQSGAVFAYSSADAFDGASDRHAPSRRNACRRDAGRVRGLYRDQRNLRQLAGALARARD